MELLQHELAEETFDLWTRTPAAMTKEANYIVTLDIFSENPLKGYKPYAQYRNLFKPESSVMQRMKSGNFSLIMNDAKDDIVKDATRDTTLFCVYLKDVAAVVLDAYVEPHVVSLDGENTTFYTLKAVIKPTGPYGSILEKNLKAQNQCCYSRGRYLLNTSTPNEAFEVVTYRLYFMPVEFSSPEWVSK